MLNRSNLIKIHDKGVGGMFITINGHVGSGKSTVCSLLKEKYGFDVFSTGTIQRQLARKRNMTTLDLNKLSENDCSIDHYIDRAVVEFAENNKGELVVFDSRLAWHFVPNSFKVRLTINPIVAAERIVPNRLNPEESYESVEDAIHQLSKRQKSEALRYKSIYSIDVNDPNNYDLIVDTGQLTPEEVANTIYDAYCHFCKKIIVEHIVNSQATNTFINTAVVADSIYAALEEMQNCYVISVDEILNNEITTYRNRNIENPNKRLLEKDILVIDSFETCNGKEATQRILYEIITKRMQSCKPTLLLAKMGLRYFSTISSELEALLNDLFAFLP